MTQTQTLANRVAIITGGNQGLGFEIARQYLAAGASVSICARNEESLREARDELARAAGPGQKVTAVRADVSSPSDVSMLARTTIQEHGHVDILVNNAGVYGPMGPIEDVNWSDWVRAIEINLMGSILPCRELIPHFKARGRGRIVQLSGGGATNPLPFISAYACSKAAIVRFVETLAQEVREHGITVNAIAPGALNTRMLDEVLEAGADRVGSAFFDRAMAQKSNGGAPLEKGAALAVFLGSDASDGITGKLLSAIWDPWTSLDAARRELLAKSDIFTLRRIVPQDRGVNWDEEE